jgi:hypothetical protein
MKEYILRDIAKSDLISEYKLSTHAIKYLKTHLYIITSNLNVSEQTAKRYIKENQETWNGKLLHFSIVKALLDLGMPEVVWKKTPKALRK